MKVLVTGGAGFVGSHLVRRLLSSGHTVTSLDKKRGLFDDELQQLGATLVSGSVADAGAVKSAMAGQELVFNLASPFGDPRAPYQSYWDTEVQGTRNVLEAARRQDVQRVVHCSTQSVHGVVGDLPGDEDSPIRPPDYHSFSKAMGERVIRQFVDDGMDVVVVRPTSVYGPGDVRGWLNLFRMAKRGWFVMVGSGSTYNHPVYIENLVDLFELTATAPQAKGRVYLAGDDEFITLTDLIGMVGEALGTTVRIVRFPYYGVARLVAATVETVCRPLGMLPLTFRRRLSWFVTNRAFSIDRARNELGYEPRISLAEGLARTAAWYRESGYMGREAALTVGSQALRGAAIAVAASNTLESLVSTGMGMV